MSRTTETCLHLLEPALYEHPCISYRFAYFTSTEILCGTLSIFIFYLYINITLLLSFITSLPLLTGLLYTVILFRIFYILFFIYWPLHFCSKYLNTLVKSIITNCISNVALFGIINNNKNIKI